MKNSMLFALMLFFSVTMFAQTYSFQSINYPTRYIRHANSQGLISEITTELDQKDASFKMVNAGLAECPSCVRLESVNYPGKFLRHANSTLWLNELSNDLDFKDATFRPVSGLANTGTSFESYNYPGYYIRHAFSRLRIDPNTGDDLFKNDATFNCIEPLYKPQPAAPAGNDFSALKSDQPIIDERVPDYYVLMKVCNRYWAGTDCTVYVSVQDATGYSSGWIALDEAGNDFTVDSQYAYQVNFGRKLQSPVKLWVKLGNEYSDSMCLEGVGLSTNPNSPNFIQMSENNDFWLEPGTSTVELGF